jgi:large subunit ribosomal protein L29
MNAREIRDLDDETLVERVAAARRELFGLRMQNATGELENTAGIPAAKRDLARLLTIARQRGIDPRQPLPDSDDDRTPAAAGAGEAAA